MIAIAVYEPGLRRVDGFTRCTSSDDLDLFGSERYVDV